MAGLTLQDLIDSSRARADMVNSDYILDAEWTDYINEGGSELHDILLSSDPSCIINKSTINTNGSTESYALPADFYKVMGVYYLQGGTRYYLTRTDFHGLGMGNESVMIGVSGNGQFQYALVGDKIYFYPIPTSLGPVELWYYPAYVRLASTTDTVDYPVVNGWEQFIILTAVIKAKMKEESDIQAELTEKAELKKRITTMATARDNFNAPQVRDVYGATGRFRRYNMVSGGLGSVNNRRWW